MKKTGVVSLFSAGPFQRFHGLCRHPAKKFVSVPIRLMLPSNRRMRRENWSVLISIWQKSCVSVLIRNVLFVENPLDALIPSLKSEENRRDYVFAVDY